jgi:uncharacterized protein (DUF1810 family)
MDKWFDLQRFVDAQDGGDTYKRATEELRQGAKWTHWMWFVFPQIAGLGHSSTSQRYAIAGLDEARAYLDHPVLGARLVECAQILLDLGTTDPVAVLGGIDAQKLRSSMTLFSHADPDQSVFDEVLARYFSGEEDEATTARL